MRWSAPDTVAGFAQSPPNEMLMRYAQACLRFSPDRLALDIGCGAGRNGVPLARAGWRIFGTDTSTPMIEAAVRRFSAEDLAPRATIVRAAMHALPVRSRSVDLIVAHGIWNLARSGEEFRRAVGEAARVARMGAAVFLFTFSRNTLPTDVSPVPGERFVFTEFAGEPQCFLTADQIVAELGAAGFDPDPALPLRELNRPAGPVRTISGPVIYEGAFRLMRAVPG